jgi:hypothetical protein
VSINPVFFSSTFFFIFLDRDFWFFFSISAVGIIAPWDLLAREIFNYALAVVG